MPTENLYSFRFGLAPITVVARSFGIFTFGSRQNEEVRETEPRRGDKTCNSLLFLLSHILFHPTRNNPGRRHATPPPALAVCHVESAPQRGSNAPLLLMHCGLGTVLSHQLSKYPKYDRVSSGFHPLLQNHASVSAVLLAACVSFASSITDCGVGVFSSRCV